MKDAELHMLQHEEQKHDQVASSNKVSHFPTASSLQTSAFTRFLISGSTLHIAGPVSGWNDVDWIEDRIGQQLYCLNSQGWHHPWKCPRIQLLASSRSSVFYHFLAEVFRSPSAATIGHY
eukprot:scaffold8230_cov94-Cylindrotheca_fusiformis.AAC.4